MLTNIKWELRKSVESSIRIRLQNISNYIVFFSEKSNKLCLLKVCIPLNIMSHHLNGCKLTSLLSIRIKSIKYG